MGHLRPNHQSVWGSSQLCRGEIWNHILTGVGCFHKKASREGGHKWHIEINALQQPSRHLTSAPLFPPPPAFYNQWRVCEYFVASVLQLTCGALWLFVDRKAILIALSALLKGAQNQQPSSSRCIAKYDRLGFSSWKMQRGPRCL